MWLVRVPVPKTNDPPVPVPVKMIKYLVCLSLNDKHNGFNILMVRKIKLFYNIETVATLLINWMLIDLEGTLNSSVETLSNGPNMLNYMKIKSRWWLIRLIKFEYVQGTFVKFFFILNI